MMNRLTVWRRRWCMRRGHPMADRSPVCITFKAEDWVMPDGSVLPGEEWTQRAWRCARHDRESKRMKPGVRLVCRFVAWWSFNGPRATMEKPMWLWRIEAWFLGIQLDANGDPVLKR